MRLRNIIFDLDGTLVDSAEGVADAINFAFTREGLPPQPVTRLAEFIGYPLEDTFAAFTDIPYERLHDHFQERASRTVVSSTRALPGADETVRQLHGRGLRMAIASTKRRSHIDGIVLALGWRELFTSLRGGNEVARVKPAPDIFLSVMDELNASTSDTIVVGDTENDIRAARDCGLTVVAVESPYGNHDTMRAAGPDYIIPLITDLPALLDDQFELRDPTEEQSK